MTEFISEYKNEAQFESDFFQFLINSNKYCLIKRQFKTSTDDTRLDIICIDNDFQLIIFELKMKLNKLAIKQAESYQIKYSPMQCYVVYHLPLSNNMKKKIENECTDIGIIEFQNKTICVLRESLINNSSEIPEDMILRLNADYLTKSKIITVENAWFNDHWQKYSIKKMIEKGYLTEHYRKKWWLLPTDKKIKIRRNHSIQYQKDVHKSLLDF